MLLTEYDEEKQMELTRRNAYKEGKICGFIEGMRDVGKTDDEIIEKLMIIFGIRRRTAENYMKENHKE